MTGELAHRGEGQHLVRLGEARLEVPPVGGECGMGVDVDEPRQQDVAREVEAGPGRSGLGAERRDPAVLDPNDRVSERRAAPAIDEGADPQREVRLG